jgi:hypothetical protein
MCHLCGGNKIELKKCVVEKIKNTEGSEMSVSLLVVKMVCSLFKFCSSVQCSECRPTIGYNVPALGEVANFGTDCFLSKIKFLARNKRVFTTKFAILPSTHVKAAIQFHAKKL